MFGCGFFSGLTLVLITLKLLGYVTFSWFWVLVPSVIPLFILIACAGIIAALDR